MPQAGGSIYLSLRTGTVALGSPKWEPSTDAVQFAFIVCLVTFLCLFLPTRLLSVQV